MAAKVKAIKKDEDRAKSIEELEASIKKMDEDKAAKLKSAKEQLVSQLEVTRDKYLTATGVYEAMRTIRAVAGTDAVYYIEQAQGIASDLADICQNLADEARDTSADEMDGLLDGVYDKGFAYKVPSPGSKEMAVELMVLDLCRNVGPACEDMVSFAKRVDEETAKSIEKLEKLKAENDG